MNFDYETIKQQVKEVIKYSQSYSFEPNVDSLMDKWLEAKRDFIELFNGKLIYEFPTEVSFELGPAQKNSMVEDFAENFLSGAYYNYELACFVLKNREGFFLNRVCDVPNEYADRITTGMKLIKTFKFFEDDPVKLNAMQMEASRIIQTNKIHGKMCLSVHPLDFLSVSENTHNWRSCHALDGEYRAGNLSYMVDSCTTIMYLKSEKDCVLPDFPNSIPWNSKKWRMLLYWSDNWNMLFAGRQYPFDIVSIRDWIKNVFFNGLSFNPAINHWSNWSNFQLKKLDMTGEIPDIIYFDRALIPIGSGLKPIDDVIVDCEPTLHFNDLLKSSYYTPYYMYKRKNRFDTQGEDNIKFHVGKRYKCLCCDNDYPRMTESFLCTDCELRFGTSETEDIVRCCSCGDRYMADNICWVDDNPYCPSCYDQYIGYCGLCGEYFDKDVLVYDYKKDCNLCPECYDEVIRERRERS